MKPVGWIKGRRVIESSDANIIKKNNIDLAEVNREPKYFYECESGSDFSDLFEMVAQSDSSILTSFRNRTGSMDYRKIYRTPIQYVASPVIMNGEMYLETPFPVALYFLKLMYLQEEVREKGTVDLEVVYSTDINFIKNKILLHYAESSVEEVIDLLKSTELSKQDYFKKIEKFKPSM